MTNKEKYPNAEIKGPSIWGYYIVLDNDKPHKTTYLVNNAPSINNCIDGWHPTREQAESALDNFMNETSEITLNNKKGYCIGVRTSGKDTLPISMCEEIKTISVIAHDGQTYTAESDGDCWKFACARISKTLIKQSLNLMNDKNFGGNRQIEKITIGKCDFTRETLQALAELGE